MAIGFGLSAALFFALADLVARSSTRTLGVKRTLFYMQLVGLLGLTIFLLLTEPVSRIATMFQGLPFLWGLLSAVVTIVGYLYLYQAFALGKLAVVSPIASSYAAVTVVLSVLSGERLKLVQLAGILLVLVGVVFSSLRQDEPRDVENSIQTKRFSTLLPSGVAAALIASLCMGFGFWLLGFAVTPTLGDVFPVWLYRLVGVMVLMPVMLRTNEPLTLPRGRWVFLLLCIGILDTAAFLFNTFGFATGEIAIVSVLSSLYSAITVVLAWIFLQERLHRVQWIGILLLLFGILLTQL